MKKFQYILLLCLLLAIASCSKKIDIAAPQLTVALDQSHLAGDTYTYKLGDTTKFSLSGYADNISLFTGDQNHNYNYRNRDTSSGTPTLTFSSTVQYGTQANTLMVLATNKLAKVDSANVVAAQWTDITSRVNLATSATATASGNINLKDLINGPKDSLFVAFKYVGQTGSTQRTWTITNFAVNNVLPDGTAYPISNLPLDINGFFKFKIGASTANWTNSTSQLQVAGGAATAPNNTSWIVTKPLYVNTVNRDVAVVLKNVGSANITSYNYKYTIPGNYTATFVIFNDNIDQQKSTIQQFKIKINP